ncbi:MAG: FAD-linked oxidase C-terminal domain-containing protein [Acidobacteriota bacterium]|nr:FAD-binding protein [Blastocatellia bacterium]MDW8240354.1 FAD-linked oxidase C-terminal domain-containing protein [Acidobacteriota bacterium]
MPRNQDALHRCDSDNPIDRSDGACHNAPAVVDELVARLGDALGTDRVLSEPDELLVYECDGLTYHKSRPRAVVFPQSTEEVSNVLRILADHDVPFVARGAGTGLSGGAVAQANSVIIELARMNRILKIDYENQLAVVEPGVINVVLSQAVADRGYFYAPDPSSQTSCTLGGNVAENAGGPHCLKYGMTTNHILGLEVVLPNGEIIELGGEVETVGYDLRGVFVGSEGMFGIATKITVRLTRRPQAVKTLLADFTSVVEASQAVSDIIAAGILPAALEMMDNATIRAVEASVFAAGNPTDAAAVLIVELDGFENALVAEAERITDICRANGARTVRQARNEAERAQIWAGRKGAFGAMGRISPDLMIQDAVVPRSKLPDILGEILKIGQRLNLTIANVFHAGDGNLHPNLMFDARDPAQVERVKQASEEIMHLCVQAGGSITGEHGVGLDKINYMPLIFTQADIDAMARVRACFDPDNRCNPGKVLPIRRCRAF